MKKIWQANTQQLFQVESEPGDCTRYSYFFFRDGPSKFIFMPCDNTFRYPQRLDYYDVVDLTKEQLLRLAQEEHCNPCTLYECIETIKEVIEYNA